MTNDLIAARLRWLQAAHVYYLSPGDDSGMSDHEWDHIGRELYARRKELPGCPVLNDSSYPGGSIYWVTYGLYEEALKANPLRNPQ